MMDEKYILYLDILGFSNLSKSSDRVLELYKIIDDLNVHEHYAFHCIVFSDTLLVYNKIDPQTAYDRHYCVMYLAEFAQDLLYRLIGREYYFRAILCKGSFLHREYNHFEAFFGQSIIDAYSNEKSLIGCGLFIDSCLLPDNQIFPTIRHCDKYQYVFLTQDIDRIGNFEQDEYPLPKGILDDTSGLNQTFTQLFFLSDIYQKASHHSNPRVRSKFQATWSFYRQKYPALCDVWLTSKFQYEAIVKADWKSAKRRFIHDIEISGVVPEGTKVS